MKFPPPAVTRPGFSCVPPFGIPVWGAGSHDSVEQMITPTAARKRLSIASPERSCGSVYRRFTDWTTACADGRTSALPRTPFFFQAEDGIRDLTVTGVQTCALPI